PLVTDPIITATSLAFAYGVLTGQTTMGTAFVTGVRTWPLLVMTSALTVLGAMVPTGWLFALAYGHFAQAFNGGEGFLMIALPFAAMLALAVPGIYIGVRLFAAVPILFVERHTPFSAIRRSWILLKGQWWSTALAFVPLGAMLLILGALLSLVLVGSPFADLLLPSRPAWSGGILALRIAGPLGWTLYMLCCLRLLKQGA
ncbi:MAG: glycerophosphoryl diester phosphodiesterase membrane domain-containing protein, partial [Gemmatimonadaceae bacterium]|nr:glycerophosphoryl diester phosphodiesterase membrane domain-containing protein [Gloeobacterales cyanobacterium ES-bin-141]